MSSTLFFCPFLTSRLSDLWLHCSTSPSIYLEMIGTATVSDHCGTIDRVATGTIVALPADGVSTLSFNVSIGSTILVMAESGYPPSLFQSLKSYTKTLNIRDLACPTWGFASVSYTASTVQMEGIDGKTRPYVGNLTQSVVGPPFNPIILPPKELLSLDPAWARCSDFEFVYNLFDPPRALTAVPAMSSATTSNSPSSESSFMRTPTAKPGDTISSNLPAITAGPDTAHPERSSLTSIPHSDQKLSADAANTPPLASSIQLPSLADLALGSSVIVSPQDPGPKYKPSIPSTSSAHLPSVSIGRAGNDPGSAEGIGTLVHSALGGHISSGDPTSFIKQDTMIIPIAATAKWDSSVRSLAFSLDPNVLYPGSSLSTFHTISLGLGEPGAGLSGIPSFTAGGQTSTIDSSELLVAGSTTVAGGSGAIVSGLPISLHTSGVVMVGSSTVDAADVINAPATSAFTIDGATFTADPSGFSVDATKVVPGSSAVTVSGTPISLDPSGNLVVDSSTMMLPSVHQPIQYSPSMINFNGATFAIGSQGFSLDNTIITPGNPAITLSGTPIGLDPSNKLIVGTSTTILPSATRPLRPFSTFTVNGVTFIANPSGLAIDKTALVVSGADIIISSTSISLDSSDKLIVGSSTTVLHSAYESTLASSILTVNEATFTAKPSGLAIHNTDLLSGGPAITVSGIPMSLDPSNKLVVGSSTTILAPLQSLIQSSTFVINQGTLTIIPSGLVMDNITLAAGAADITVSGTTYSLESSGKLHVGTSETLLPSGSVNGMVAFVGAGMRGVEGRVCVVVLVGVGVVVGSVLSKVI